MMAWIAVCLAFAATTVGDPIAIGNHGNLSDIALAPDGSVLLCGSRSFLDGENDAVEEVHGWVTRLTASGSSLWSRSIGQVRRDVVEQVVVAPDGTIALIASFAPAHETARAESLHPGSGASPRKADRRQVKLQWWSPDLKRCIGVVVLGPRARLAPTELLLTDQGDALVLGHLRDHDPAVSKWDAVRNAVVMRIPKHGDRPTYSRRLPGRLVGWSVLGSLCGDEILVAGQVATLERSRGRVWRVRASDGFPVAYRSIDEDREVRPTSVGITRSGRRWVAGSIAGRRRSRDSGLSERPSIVFFDRWLGETERVEVSTSSSREHLAHVWENGPLVYRALLMTSDNSERVPWLTPPTPDEGALGEQMHLVEIDRMTGRTISSRWLWDAYHPAGLVDPLVVRGDDRVLIAGSMWSRPAEIYLGTPFERMMLAIPMR